VADLHRLPPDLPVPEDDGAADHLPGLALPALTLQSSQGDIDLMEIGRGLLVLYVYPRTGRPGEPVPDGWDAVPGARGCTVESCAFRDERDELMRRGVTALAGLSAQPLAEQAEFARREHIPYPVLADPELRLAAALRLPTFRFAGVELYRRVTLVAERSRIVAALYPVFPPDAAARDVAAWLDTR
jgi:peroxiredoxin